MSFSFERFARNMSSKIEPPVRQHLTKVYGCLAGTTTMAGFGAYCFLMNIFQGDMICLFGSIGLLIGLFVWRDNGKNFYTRLSMLLAFGFLSGNSMGPLLNLAIRMDPQIIVTALVGTSVIFLALTVAALTARRGQYLFLGGLLMSVLSYMMLFSFANIFMRTRIIYQAELYIGLAVMAAFILFDTQMIMEKYEMGNRDPITHSLDLFCDIINFFRRLVILLTQKKEREQRKKRND